MATEKQIAANRQNVRNITGPRTELGKRRSRRNAVRHGLTAETVIDVLEDPAAYKTLQRAIYADYRPRTNFELELVARLVSLLWRLRRAVAIESGSLAIHTKVAPREKVDKVLSDKLDIFYRLIPSLIPAVGSGDKRQSSGPNQNTEVCPTAHTAKRDATHVDIARSYLRLASIDRMVFERLGRYEASLWRQTVQTILLLNSLNSRARDERLNCNALRLKMHTKHRRYLWPPFDVGKI